MPTPPRLRPLTAALTLAGLALAGGTALPASAASLPPRVDAASGGPVPATGAARTAPATLLRGRGLVLDAAAGTPAPPAVSASAYVLADLDTGEVLAAKDAHGRYAPASTLKILTAMTLLPQLDLNKYVPATFADANVPGSRVGVVPGGKYSVESLFEALMMVSGNDAALTLSDANGGVAKTVAEMNATAARLGAADTHATTPHGLDSPGQTSSAYDLALLGRDGLRNPDFARIVGRERSFFGAQGARRFAMFTHNRLVINYPGALGIKNGYTVKAQASFVGAAQRGGHRLVVSLLHAQPRVWHEAASLLDWGFAHRPGLHPVGQLADPSSQPTNGSGAGGASAPLPSHLPGVATQARHRLNEPLLGAVAVAAALGLGLGMRLRARRRVSPLRLPRI